MSKIIIKDGHFWKDGIKLVTEIGNVEQISALREYNALYEDFKKGVCPKYEYKVSTIATAIFKCFCGNSLEIKTDADYEGDEKCFEGQKKKCYHCNRNYKFVTESIYRVQGGKRIYYGDNALVTIIN